MALDESLTSLIGHFDDWFKDLALREPVSQFELYGSIKELDETPEEGGKTRKRDNIKLGIISRTTTNWFRPLSNPLITDDDFPISDVEAEVRDEEEDEETQLDTFAKDLELLLYEDSTQPAQSTCNKLVKRNEQLASQQDIYYFPNHSTNEIALTDPGIGHCCTIRTTPAYTNGKPSQAITVLQTTLQSSRNQMSDLKKKDNRFSPRNHHLTQTPMPLDHDYLARPKQKPFLTRNTISQPAITDFHTLIDYQRQKIASPLNTGAMKRFARFSDRLRLLSCE